MYQTFVIKKMKGSSSYSFVASTATSDRYGDVIEQAGWQLDNYKRNPVVLFNHNSLDLPIGKGKVDVKNGQLMIDVDFDQTDEFAKKIEEKVKGGYINAVSVGFSPIESTPRSKLDKNHKYYSKFGTLYTKSELLEVSIVTIPANGEATMSKNIRKGLTDLIRSIVQDEIKHILEVEFLDDGNYKVTFEGHSEDMEEEPVEEMADKEDMPEEDMAEDEMPEEEKMGYKDEEEKNYLNSILKHLQKNN